MVCEIAITHLSVSAFVPRVSHTGYQGLVLVTMAISIGQKTSDKMATYI